MLGRIPAGLFGEWLAFDGLEPISLGWRGDRQAAMLASILTNIYRDQKKRPEPYETADFMPEYGARKPKTAQELFGMLKSWAVAAKETLKGR